MVDYTTRKDTAAGVIEIHALKDMGQKQVAIFAEKLYNGGVERILQIVLRNIDRSKYDITLYSQLPEHLDSACYPTNLKHRHIFNAGTSLWSKGMNKLKLWVYYHCSPQLFYKLFIRKKYDLGIAFIEGYATRYLAGGPRDMKKIAWVHTDLEAYHWTSVAYKSITDESECYNKFNQIVTVSKTAQAAFHRVFPEVTVPISTIYNPIDSNIIKYKANEFKLPPRQNGIIRIITAGHFNAQKRLDRLIRIVKKLNDDGYQLQLWMLGDGPLLKDIKNLILKLSLNHVITLWGYQSNPYPYYTASDLYVGCSITEGFCTAFTECLILGVPVITTEVSGAREQFGDNEWGIITENNETALYEGIKDLLDNPDKLTHYRKQAIERGRMFTLEKSIQEIENLIDCVISEK